MIRWPRRLAHRVLLFHVSAFVLAAVALVLVRPRPAVDPRPMDPARLGAFVAARLEQHGAVTAAARAEARAWHDELGFAVAVFGPAGDVLLDTDGGVRPAPELERGLAAGQVRPIGRRGRVAVALPALGAGAYAVVQPRWPPPRRPADATLAAVVLLSAVVLASAAFSRTLVRPIERLAGAARALGGGDLRARTGFERADELGDLGRAFDEMADELASLVQSQKEVLANISHELRTPLARIQVAIDIAREGDAAAAQAALVDLDEDVGELKDLVNDVLTTARLELATGRAGRPGPGLRLEAVQPRALLERAAARFRTSAPGRTLEVDLAADLPSRLFADPTLLRRAVDNLLDNARKYSTQKVRLSARAEGDALRIDVVDRGEGMTAEETSQLYTPFFRGRQPRRTSGVGLGLVLTHRIVEAHGGTIEVDSAPGQGTRFTLRIPVDA